MNMPYSIPRYEQPASIWEKALASFLVNAAGGVASRGAENLMSRDYAKEFGEKPTSGFSRLLGPNVGAEDAKQRRAIGAQKEMSQAEINAANTRASEDRELRKNLDAMEGSREWYRLQQGVLDKTAAERAAAQRQADEIQSRFGLAREAVAAERSDPRNIAQANYYTQGAEKLGSEAAFNRSFIPSQTTAPGTTPPPGGVSPEDAAAMEALRRKNQAGAAPAQAQLSTEQQIQKWLAEGRTLEDIKVMLSPALTPRQQKVQASAEQLRLRDEQRAMQEQQTIQQLMAEAGLLPTINPNDPRRLR